MKEIKQKNKRILLVEDVNELKLIMKMILESDDFEVVTASNGEAALALYNNSFDVILTDIVMPVMGGIRLIRELKRINPDVKCLAITGFSDAAVPTEIPLIHKPVSSSKLLAFVRNELIN
ncbi:MAG: response regulator [Candidatus Heimdallarchaeota archaeon]